MSNVQPVSKFIGPNACLVVVSLVGLAVSQLEGVVKLLEGRRPVMAELSRVGERLEYVSELLSGAHTVLQFTELAPDQPLLDNVSMGRTFAEDLNDLALTVFTFADEAHFNIASERQNSTSRHIMAKELKDIQEQIMQKARPFARANVDIAIMQPLFTEQGKDHVGNY